MKALAKTHFFLFIAIAALFLTVGVHADDTGIEVDGSEIFIPEVSSSLQPGDRQYVHDVFCKKTGRYLGTVRSMWAHKYGSRYGGVGIEATGDLRYVGRGENGRGVRLEIVKGPAVEAVRIEDRLAKIPD